MDPFEYQTKKLASRYPHPVCRYPLILISESLKLEYQRLDQVKNALLKGTCMGGEVSVLRHISEIIY